MLVFIHNLGCFAGRPKDVTQRKDFVLDPGPAPDTITPAREDGREIEVLGSVYRAGQDHSHPHPFSN